jgi:hypothetical protein
MPLVVGGPPEWIWERTADPLRCEINQSKAIEGHTVFEVTVRCGLEIMRLHFLTRKELESLYHAIGVRLGDNGVETKT